MSTFFKALEQAERERLERTGTPTAEVGSPDVAEPAVPPPPQPPAAPRPRAAAAVADPRPVADGPVGEVDEHLVSLLNPAAPAAEQYRALRHTLEHLKRTAGHSVFAVSSPRSGDGKTTTAINLAGALAQAPQARVLLIDADLRAAAVADRLGLAGIPAYGLVDLILGPDLGLDDAVQRCEPYNIAVIVAGERPPAPYEILKSPRFGALLDEARARYDYVILDAPPLVSLLDGRVVGRWADGVLLVVAAHRTPRKLLEEALDVLEPARTVGLVFNRDDGARLAA